MTEEDEFDQIKEAVLSDGGKLLLEDIKKNLQATDTIKVLPQIEYFNDENGRPIGSTVICSQHENMMKTQGYVLALEWVIGVIEHYQNAEFEQTSENFVENG